MGKSIQFSGQLLYSQVIPMHTNSGQRLYLNPFILIYTPIQEYAFSEAAELQGRGPASQNRQENANLTLIACF